MRNASPPHRELADRVALMPPWSSKGPDRKDSGPRRSSAAGRDDANVTDLSGWHMVLHDRVCR